MPPAFADDPTLDLSAHVRRIALPGDGSERALLDLCGALAEQPLDRARPLWEFTLIEGLDDGRAALLQKIHHTITDGVGGLRLSLAFVDFEPDATPDPQPAERDDDHHHDTPLHATRDRGGRRHDAQRSRREACAQRRRPAHRPSLGAPGPGGRHRAHGPLDPAPGAEH